MSARPTTSQALRASAAGFAARGILALPRPVLRRLAGPPPAHAAGLDPEAWMLARLASAGATAAADVPVELGRVLFARQAAPLAPARALPVDTSDHVLPGGLHARLFRPWNAVAGGPLLLYLHGGGWVRGSVATHEHCCQLLAHLAGVRVLSLDYRLAPEQPFPAAFDDARAAYEAVVADPGSFGADPERLAVGGDSAGGNLAAALALDLRGGPLPEPVFQLLIYPAVDLDGTYPSEGEFGEGYFLTKANMDWYCDQYVPDRERRRDPRVSPLLADDLAGLPPAYVATALADPLRDEGEAYARRLAAAGVPTVHHRHPLIHGFFTPTGVRSSREAIAVVAGVLRQALTPLA